MLDDIRNHDARPTDQERRWIDQNLGSLGRLVVIGLVAVVIGSTAGDMLSESGREAVAAVLGP